MRLRWRSNVTATFSEAITGFSTTTATVRAGTAAPVAAAVTFAAATRVLTINPNANLANDTLYTVTLTGGTAAIRDTAGNPLATTTWTFRTGPAPTVTARTPASAAVGASRTANVTATFSENVSAGAGSAANVSLRVGTPATGALIAGGGDVQRHHPGGVDQPECHASREHPVHGPADAPGSPISPATRCLRRSGASATGRVAATVNQPGGPL